MFVAKALFLTAFLVVSRGNADKVENAEKTTQRVINSLIKYYVVTWNNTYETVTRNEHSSATIRTAAFSQDQRVTVLVHGQGDSNSAFYFLTSLGEALLRKHPNLVVVEVDWSLVNAFTSDLSVLVNGIGEHLRDFIISAKFNVNFLHLVGFDAGAHIVGYASRTIQVRKITGLDPVGGNDRRTEYRLRETDAQYLEVIHTDFVGTKAIGIAEPIGTVDIYVNSAATQPGCATNNNLCNHLRAVDLFDASIRFDGHLFAMRCLSWDNVNKNNCTGLPPVVLGTNDLFKTGLGYYRVNTGRAYPFNL